MENAPLNKAHQLERRAEALFKQKKFDECSKAYEEAITFFRKALAGTTNSYAIESIQLQIAHDQKQMSSLKIKKLQYEQHLRHCASIKNRVNFIDSNIENGDTLQNEIYHTIGTHDSLIDLLLKRDQSDEGSDSGGPGVDSHDGASKLPGRKRDVDDSILLEEFKGLSVKLRELVETLLKEVDIKDKEISVLNKRIVELESEKNQAQSKSNNSLKVITDSSGGTSPYVFSPMSELSPEVPELRTLPSLGPLELPTFDFLQLVNKSTSSTNNTNTE